MTREISRGKPYPQDRTPDQLEDLWHHIKKQLPDYPPEQEPHLKSFLLARLQYVKLEQQEEPLDPENSPLTTFEKNTPDDFFDTCHPQIRLITSLTNLNPNGTNKNKKPPRLKIRRKVKSFTR